MKVTPTGPFGFLHTRGDSRIRPLGGPIISELATAQQCRLTFVDTMMELNVTLFKSYGAFFLSCNRD